MRSPRKGPHVNPEAEKIWREKLVFYENEVAITPELGGKCWLWLQILGIKLLFSWQYVVIVLLLVGMTAAWQWGRGLSPERQEATQPVTQAGQRERTPYDDVPVTIDANGIPLRQVLLDCAHQAKLTLGFQPIPDRKVTLKLEKAPLASVLDDLCNTYSCRWRILQKPAPVLLVTFPE